MMRRLCKIRKSIFILKILIFMFCNFTVLIVKSQTNDYERVRNNFVVFPSPKSWAFSNYGNYPMSLYTGTPEIKIDLFDLRVNQFNLNVGLSYSTLENKPSNFPSEVGLGFSLQVGGVITRVLKSLPDDDVRGYYFNGGNIQQYYTDRTSYLNDVLNTSLDSEPDIFHFKISNYSGTFYFDKNKNIIQDQFSNYKIDPIVDGHNFTGFIVISPDGVRYEFKDRNVSTYTINSMGANFYNSAWYLTRITLVSGQQIDFEYYPNSLDLSSANYFLSYAKTQTGGTVIGLLPSDLSTSNTHIFTHYEKYLKKIKFPLGSIEFEMSNRIDRGAQKTKKLDAVNLLDKNGLFNYGYSFAYIENQDERFKLSGILKNTSQTTELYRNFTYNSQLLPWGSNPNYPYYSNQVDYWGYYNGLNGVDGGTIPQTLFKGTLYGDAVRESNYIYASAEVLKRISYPTGGYTEFRYELNDFSLQGDSYSPKRKTSVSSHVLSFEYEDGTFSVDPYSLEFTLENPTLVEVSKNLKGGGPNTKWIVPSSTNYQFYSMTLSPGTYNAGSILNANYLLHWENSDVVMASGAVSFGYMEAEELTENEKAYGGGLRVAEIINHDGQNTISKKYLYKDFLTSQNSSGILTKMPTHVISAASLIPNVQGIFSSSTPILGYDESEVLGYSSVIELNEDNSYTKFVYSTIFDVPDETALFELGVADPLLSANISRKSSRGKLLREETYNSIGDLIKSTQYTYSDFADNRSKSIQYVLVQPTFPLLANYPGGELHTDRLSATMNTLYTRYFPFTALVNKRTIRKDGGSENIHLEEFKYDNSFHAHWTRNFVSKSNKDSFVTYVTYPLDYNSGFESLISKNILNVPVETVNTVKNENQEHIVSGVLNQYSDNGKLSQYSQLDISEPLTDFKFSNRLSGQIPPNGGRGAFIADSRYNVKLSVPLYDTYGNPLAVKKTNGPVTSYLWGYNGQYPVAEIVNAQYNDVVSAIGGQSVVDELNSGTVTADYIRQKMDILRSNLPGSQITSYTYKPLVGMTSKTDARGQTEYYQYDGLQRLQHVLDQF
ncbi:hypothetical protein ACFU8T_13430, partial [Sphingobacterium spiritivorum]